MGLRIRKTLAIIPGVKLNLSKSGGSLSFGNKGFTVNLGKSGTRETVGLPGSGVSYSRYQRHSGKLSFLGSVLMIGGALLIYYLRG